MNDKLKTILMVFAVAPLSIAVVSLYFLLILAQCPAWLWIASTVVATSIALPLTKRLLHHSEQFELQNDDELQTLLENELSKHNEEEVLDKTKSISNEIKKETQPIKIEDVMKSDIRGRNDITSSDAKLRIEYDRTFESSFDTESLDYDALFQNCFQKNEFNLKNETEVLKSVKKEILNTYSESKFTEDMSSYLLTDENIEENFQKILKQYQKNH